MPDKTSTYARVAVLVPRELYEQAKERCDAEDLTIAVVLRTALQDYVLYGMDMHVRRGASEAEEEVTEVF